MKFQGRVFLVFLLLLVGCGCPPCEDGVTKEHWDVLGCAGYDGYVEDNVGCVELKDVLYRNGEEKAGTTDCDCVITKVRILPEHFGRECETIVHEAAHLEEGCIDREDYAEQVATEFLQAMHDNDCWDLADSYNKQGGIL